MTEKHSFKDMVIVCYGTYMPWGEYKSRLLSKATARHHIHNHKPSRRPYVGGISPAEYRRRHLGVHNG